MNKDELKQYIADTYGISPEYPWMRYPDYGVYRHSSNRKWFAVMMELSKEKLGLSESGALWVVNVKCDPILVGSLITETGIFPGYHMNKNHWITLSLDGSLKEEQIKWLLDMSYHKTEKKESTL